MEQTSTVDEFFKGLPSEDKQQADVFNDKKQEEKPDIKVEGEEEPEEGHKNRRHRRLEQQLQREREANIALNERLKVLAEQDKVIKETTGEIDPRLIRVFGTSDEAKEIAKHFTEILSETKESAREEAIREIADQENAKVAEQGKYESFIDEQLEALEDEYDVDLTSNSPQANKARKEFLTLVQQLSPKDDQGTITDYADFQSTFEIYNDKQGKVDNSRREEIASKSMQRSGTVSSGVEQSVPPGFEGFRQKFLQG